MLTGMVPAATGAPDGANTPALESMEYAATSFALLMTAAYR